MGPVHQVSRDRREAPPDVFVIRVRGSPLDKRCGDRFSHHFLPADVFGHEVGPDTVGSDPREREVHNRLPANLVKLPHKQPAEHEL